MNLFILFEYFSDNIFDKRDKDYERDVKDKMDFIGIK